MVFAISPIFGSLHAFPLDRIDARATNWRLGLFGCTSNSRSSLCWDFDMVHPPAPKEQQKFDEKQDEWTCNIQTNLRYWPLAAVIERIEARVKRTAVKPPATVDLEALLAELAISWRVSGNSECLPRAIFRYQWLRMRSLYPSLYLGVHVPTDQMHAWIALNGCVLGEEPDDMLMYQPSVRFFARSDPGQSV
jgi:Transglutaminase-like superfamily